MCLSAFHLFLLLRFRFFLIFLLIPLWFDIITCFRIEDSISVHVFTVYLFYAYRETDLYKSLGFFLDPFMCCIVIELYICMYVEFLLINMFKPKIYFFFFLFFFKFRILIDSRMFSSLLFHFCGLENAPAVVKLDLQVSQCVVSVEPSSFDSSWVLSAICVFPVKIRWWVRNLSCGPSSHNYMSQGPQKLRAEGFDSVKLV